MTPQNLLNIGLIQAPLAWEHKEKNLQYFETKINAIPEADLILLPEMFSTGFSMNPSQLAETEEGPALKWMRDMAVNRRLALSGSLIIEEGNQYFNRLFFVYPDGSFKRYDKRHLFSYAGEEKVYSAGTKKLILEYKGWRINPQICYDLRFPVWSRNSEDFDFQYYVANWPERRSEAWKTLLKARAIENQVYLAGVNRIGLDGNGINHSGDSAVYDPLGEKISDIQSGQEAADLITLDFQHLQEVRQRFAFLKDRDSFEIS